MGAVPSPVRERLVEAASELFYAQGLRAVSADRIIERVGTTKVTFYRHFRTKDDLVVAFLEREDAEYRQRQQDEDHVTHADHLVSGAQIEEISVTRRRQRS